MAVETLKVASSTEPSKLAGALTPRLREHGSTMLELMGEGAMSNAIAAVTISRGHLATSNQDCIVIPAFAPLKVDGNEDRKGYKLMVELVNIKPGTHAAAYEAKV